MSFIFIAKLFKQSKIDNLKPYTFNLLIVGILEMTKARVPDDREPGFTPSTS